MMYREGMAVADGYLFVVLNWLRFFDINVADWPNLAAHHARVSAMRRRHHLDDCGCLTMRPHGQKNTFVAPVHAATIGAGCDRRNSIR